MPSRAARRAEAGVTANARLTAANAAVLLVLLVLLAAEGVTILRVRALLTPHVFIGRGADPTGPNGQLYVS
jgi:hypothetical protein